MVIAQQAQHIIFALLFSFTLNASKSVPQKKAVPPNTKDSELQKLADAIQKNYNQTSSATFNFTQNYKHPFLPTNETSKGQVFFKARNMLWRYQEPADRQKEFFIADKKFTYHLINDKLAYTHDCFDQDTLSASITFLWGKGKLRESFIIKPYAGTVNPKSTLKWLTLIPKEAHAPVKSISLGADPKSGMVKESIVLDPSDGLNHFTFSNFKSNVAISPATFIFVAKPGVRVQPMPNVVCPSPQPTAPPAKTPILKPVKNQPKIKP